MCGLFHVLTNLPYVTCLRLVSFPVSLLQEKGIDSWPDKHVYAFLNQVEIVQQMLRFVVLTPMAADVIV